jgi:hypothetical protein
VDPAIIGGVVTRIGSTVYDGKHRDTTDQAARTDLLHAEAHATEGQTWTSERTKSPNSFATRSAAIRDG